MFGWGVGLEEGDKGLKSVLAPLLVLVGHYSPDAVQGRRFAGLAGMRERGNRRREWCARAQQEKAPQ